LAFSNAQKNQLNSGELKMMDDFDYFSAKNVKEACALLAQHGEAAKVLAGGHSLINLMKQKFAAPAYIVDIKGISDLDYIRRSEDDGLKIGGLTTHRTLEQSDLVKEKFPMLAEMEQVVASVAVRNWGTLGGNLCSADPASDLAPTLMALGAEVTLTGPDAERVVSLDDFFVDLFETVVQADEILTEIRIPRSVRSGGRHLKFALRPTDLAVVNAATHLTVTAANPDVCEDIRIVVGSVGPVPFRSKSAEELCRGQKIDAALIEKAAQVTAAAVQPTTDLNGTEEFKRDITRVLVQRTIEAATERAREL
jgi:carbon-monoxide dehydrogenase medium subunit